MALKTTVEHLRKLLHEISHDLEKAGRGNRAAAQRVRTCTIKFAKTAKCYRKESISEGRKGGKRKKTAKKGTKRKAVKRKTKKRAAPKRKKTVKRKATRRKHQ